MEEQEKTPSKVTDIDALRDITEQAVVAFAQRWLSMPSFSENCEIMDIRQLRDAMGLRATMESDDPWPIAEKLLLEYDFRWHWLGPTRVMFLRERDNYNEEDGWSDGFEVTDE